MASDPRAGTCIQDPAEGVTPHTEKCCLPLAPGHTKPMRPAFWVVGAAGTGLTLPSPLHCLGQGKGLGLVLVDLRAYLFHSSSVSQNS